MNAESATRPLVVVESVRALRATTNPYIVTLVEGLSETAIVRLFSWRVALFGRYDVLHIHWPERLYEREGRARTIVHSLLALLLVARLRVTRMAVVRTLHNLSPHEPPSRLSRLVARSLDVVTTEWITLNESRSESAARPGVLIPHPHYRDWFGPLPTLEAIPGRLAFFGQIRAYKNVDGLLSAFREVRSDEVSLVIRGAASDARLAAELSALARADTRVDLELGHVSDADLAAHILESELVVLPYRDMYNSGALLLALSLGRPVLVPDNEMTRRLAEEVGGSWVVRYSGDLDADALAVAIEPPAAARAAEPDLSAREWPRIIDLHLEVFRRAVARRRQRRAR
ncbi:glycosyltransferase [Marisediminicola sp. LYQ85]|uniref:glycosyltransferase n=1 Tax=Marisediminicola sp. LYQ85 TaxID=3391062 RepID=UPI0039835C9F